MWLLLTTSLTLAADPWCATRPGPPSAERHLPAMPSEEPSDRDAIFNVGGVSTSAHFAVKWGPELTLDPTVAQQLADDFETAYAAYIEDGYPAPFGAAVYRTNVYLAGTGLCWDSACAEPVDVPEGVAGMLRPDAQGWSVILIVPEVNDPNDPLLWASVGAHELFHLFQSDLGTWYDSSSGTAAWWEMTATWAAARVYPDYTRSYETVYAFARLPQYPIDAFTAPLQGPLTPLVVRHYGAMVFPTFLTERHDASLIREVWVSRGSSETAFERIDEVLEGDWGTSIEAVLPDFAQANLTWDYDHGDVIAAAIDRVVAAIRADPEQSDFLALLPEHPYALWLQGPTDGPVGPTADLAPRRWGANYVRLDGAGEWTVAFDADEVGSAGTPSHLTVRALVLTDAGVVREAVVDDAGITDLTLGAGEHAVWVVSATPATAADDEVFSYRFEVLPARTGCGCGSAVGRAPEVTFAFALLLLRRRAPDRSERATPTRAQSLWLR